MHTPTWKDAWIEEKCFFQKVGKDLFARALSHILFPLMKTAESDRREVWADGGGGVLGLMDKFVIVQRGSFYDVYKMECFRLVADADGFMKEDESEGLWNNAQVFRKQSWEAVTKRMNEFEEPGRNFLFTPLLIRGCRRRWRPAKERHYSVVFGSPGTA